MQKTFLKTKKKLNWNGGTVIWVILFHCKIVVVISATATLKIRLILYFLSLLIIPKCLYSPLLNGKAYV